MQNGVMNAADAMKILKEAASAPRKMEAFGAIAKRIGAPTITVYQWWWNGSVPTWRLSAFDKLKKRKAA